MKLSESHLSDNWLIDEQRDQGVMTHHLPRESPFDRPSIYTDGSLLCIENIAVLPLRRCVKTNLPTSKVVSLHLRNPFHPDTWWGETSHRLTIGLSSRAWAAHQVVRGISAMFIGGAVAAFLGALFFNLWWAPICLTLVAISGITRSITPIWAVKASPAFTSLKGVNKDYSRQATDGSENEGI